METMNNSPNCHNDVLCVEESEVTAGNENCSGRTQGLDDRRIMLELPVIKPPGDFVLPMNAPSELYYSEGNVDAIPPNNGASLLKCGFQNVYNSKRTNSSLRVHAGHQAMIDPMTTFPLIEKHANLEMTL
jgi:hypothetical protein